MTAPKTLTFRHGLVSPAGLRQMAAVAQATAERLDGVSAAHFTAWAELARSLREQADQLEGL